MAGTITKTNPQLPQNVWPIFAEGVNQLGGAQSAFPSLSEIPGKTPLLDIPNLTPEQQAFINQIQFQGSQSPALQAAQQQLQLLTTGPIGSSPATTEAMEAYRQQVMPSLLQAQAAAGRGSGGAVPEAIASGTQQALVPLLEQEIQTRSNAVGQYGNLQGQTLQSLAAALESAGLPREVAQQQAQAAFERSQQQLQFETGIQTLPLQLIPSLINTVSRTTPTAMTAMDWISGIGKGLSVSGLLGSLTGKGGS